MIEPAPTPRVSWLGLGQSRVGLDCGWFVVEPGCSSLSSSSPRCVCWCCSSRSLVVVLKLQWAQVKRRTGDASVRMKMYD